MKEKEKMGTGRKILLIIITILLLMSAALYFGGVFYFSSHFLPNSTIDGIACSFITEKEAQNRISDGISAYVLAINEKNNGVEKITAKEAGLRYVADETVGELLKKQNRWLWFLSLGKSNALEMSASTTYDTESLRKAVESLDCFQEENVTAPEDARIEETDSGYEIVAETEGNQLNKEKTLQVITEAVENGKTEIYLEEEGCYEKPAVSEDDATLKKQLEQLNQLTDVMITYDFEDREEVVDREVIRGWLKKDEEDNYVLDKNKVAEYVNQLGYKYDTFGCTRTFETYDGRTVTVKGGDYGWAIDQERETAALMKAVENGETQVREPIYSYEGWSRTENDIGSTYVEIDLTNQRMVFYLNGDPVVDTEVVTGNPGMGWETPTGVYAVDAKKSPAVLTGEDYESPVTYWMPFAGNVGIHDAPWRTEFGGELYQTEGSHGCVNTPYDQAEIIYENLEIGAPVVVYQ